MEFLDYLVTKIILDSGSQLFGLSVYFFKENRRFFIKRLIDNFMFNNHIADFHDNF